MGAAPADGRPGGQDGSGTRVERVRGPDPAAASEPPAPEPPSRGPVRSLVAVVALALVVGAAAGWLWFQSTEAPAPVRVDVPPLDPIPVPPPVEVKLPPPAESDALLRRVIGLLTAHPGLAKWLATDDLLARFVAAVDNIAEGRDPRAHLAHVAPRGTLEALEQGGRLVPAPKSLARYDLLADVVGSVDATAAANALPELEPLLDGAYHALGYPGKPFRPVLMAALRRVAAVSVGESAVELRARGAVYLWADPEVEGLDETTKLVLRTGPRNARILRAKAAELAVAVGALPPR